MLENCCSCYHHHSISQWLYLEGCEL